MNEHPGAEPQDEEKRGRKFALWSVTAFVLLIVLLFVYRRDDALGDFSDLEPTPALNADADEVFRAWEDVLALGDEAALKTETGTDPDLLRRIGGAFPWKQEPADRILAANEKMIEAALAADALGAFRFPQESDISDSRPSIRILPFLAKILKIHAIERHRAGDADAALASALAAQRLADRAITGSGVLIDLLVGVSNGAVSYSVLELLVSTERSAEALVSIENALAVEPDFATTTERLLCSEFQFSKTTLIENSEVLELADGAAIFPSLQYKANRTTNTVADHFRSVIKQVRLPPNRRSYPPPPKKPVGLAILSSNAAGNAILRAGHPPLETVIKKADVNLSNRRALRLKVAVVRYLKDHGQSPANLSALVPDYLPALPIDPFNGKPLHYDPARGAIWSVGEDGRDDGGAAKQDHNGFTSGDHPDPTLWITPLPPGVEPEERRALRRSTRQRRTEDQAQQQP